MYHCAYNICIIISLSLLIKHTHTSEVPFSTTKDSYSSITSPYSSPFFEDNSPNALWEVQSLTSNDKWIEDKDGVFKTQQTPVEDKIPLAITPSSKEVGMSPEGFKRTRLMALLNNFSPQPTVTRTQNLAFAFRKKDKSNDDTPTHLLMFTGDNCDHCEQIEPLIEKVEAELGCKVSRQNVWRSQATFKLFEKVRRGEKEREREREREREKWPPHPPPASPLPARPRPEVRRSPVLLQRAFRAGRVRRYVVRQPQGVG